jgi:hypothetical protein
MRMTRTDNRGVFVHNQGWHDLHCRGSNPTFPVWEGPSGCRIGQQDGSLLGDDALGLLEPKTTGTGKGTTVGNAGG